MEEKFIQFIKQMQFNKPNLFLFREDEPVATLNDILVIENELQAKLPKVFTEFQKNFGGGGFGYTEIFSLSPQSNYYILAEYEKFPSIPHNFLPTTDDGTGGYYGFLKDQAGFSDKIFYLDIEKDKPILEPTQWNFTEYFKWSAFHMT